jgi:hypothetical protein
MTQDSVNNPINERERVCVCVCKRDGEIGVECVHALD